ncbi:MAG: hypothetical protein ABI882_13165 [Acidobacteriota bacterium]
MAKVRAILGVIAGVLLILSSAAHALLGWKAISAQLASVQVPADLLTGLRIGWQFGAAVMLALGIIVVILFSKRLRGEMASTMPAVVISIAYLSFGIWAMIVSNFDPFFLVFLIPGSLLAVASRKVRV